MTSLRAGRLLTSTATAVLLGVMLAGCQTTRDPETTGSLGAASQPSSPQGWRQREQALAAQYRSNPDNPPLDIAYAEALRMNDQREQATAVLQQATIRHPYDRALLGAYGRALASVGRYQQALDVLSRAHTPDQPDWRILSAQGAVLDQIGRHEEARRYYASALRIEPNDPTVLSNLGLSYALSKDLVRAEQTLRRAAAQNPPDPRVRQNLALVVGLQGRFAEAEAIARADLPAAEAAANVAYLRQMLAQQKPAGGKHRPAKRPSQPMPLASGANPQPGRQG